jgi:glycosyltransferase involved in cell wall biosynthesis
VIVVDDAGPDGTANLLAGVPGVRVIRHEVNTGYVGACNSGIAAARGAYVVLLNNDTRVTKGWLSALIETLEQDGVGLVGAKLIYPDGRLQEAGGIIYTDASGCNYGRNRDPSESEFNYCRRVDYCSGAAIALRKATLDQLGGLDQTFAPAYYDDTDLAFAVRDLGLDVVYQPRCVVIHDEGVSHGTDETKGVKAHQVTNRIKFQAKWADALSRQLQPGPGPEVMEQAARARQGRDLVVVIDHSLPRPDTDSGSLRMSRLIEELARQDHGVVFIPANGVMGDRYSDTLERAGVEVVSTPRDWDKYFASLAGSVSAVIVSRVSTAVMFAPVIKESLPDVPLIFDTVDLHFLRLEREAELAPSPAASAHARVTRELELAMVRAADTTLVVSSAEKALLERLVPGADVRILSNVHPRVPDRTIPPLAGRDGLVFVGTFAHPPNRDAVEWFIAHVLPLVRLHLPDLSVRIVGLEPPAELVDAAPPGVEYLGWVKDLAPVYGSSRAAIAPLRYGAGVKGKIGEALAYGIPVVTTTVGAEGMALADGINALVANTAEDFAAAIVRIVRDDPAWRRIAADGRHHIDHLLGPAGFAQAIRELIPELPRCN